MEYPRTAGVRRRTPVVLLIGTVLTFSLAACSSGAGNANGTDEPEATAPVTAAAPPTAGSGADTSADARQSKASEGDAESKTGSGDGSRTESVRETVGNSLRELTADTPEPTRDQVQSTLRSAGFPAEKTEVSITRTPTGLEVEAIEAAVHVEDECVVAQLRDGSVALAVLPVLETGLCFVGDQR
ncbi:DUF6993 domain-containing protein [Arthrobacter monumenti]